jgi:enoyl-CoA hydratase/carnithine racemase
VTVNYEAADGVAVLTLDRPDKLNSVTTAMSERLFGLIGEIDSDDAVRAVVVTGAGPRSFCVGSDIAEVDAYPDPWQFRNRRDYCDALRALRKPVIAAVNGYAYGGGLELALSCDIRLASTTASFAAAEIKLGWIGGGGVSALLAASVPASDAALLLLTGDPVDAAEARRIGLVSRVYSPGELVAAGRSLASVIASRPPVAAQAAKANLLAARSMGLEQAIQYEREMQAICMGTRDAAEGRSAFAEKRPPHFTGH